MRVLFNCALLIVCLGCSASSVNSPQAAPQTPQIKSRASAIPANAVKMSSSLDVLPPILQIADFDKPVPLGSTINTAGAEDSAFILPDGNTIYYFFTPDVTVPAQKQLLDGVTGIYMCKKQGGQWEFVERILLQDKNDISLDGCVFVQGNEMWFCSARKGNYRDVDLWTASYKNNRWSDWKNAGKKLNVDYQVGEMHIASDGNVLFFHSAKTGTKGGLDIWQTNKVNGDWQEPESVAAVNTPENEGWPFLTQDGKELWFTRNFKGSPAVYRSKKDSSGKWSNPELVVSQFAAEPTLDSAGNLYFIHHYFKDGKMIEADVYMAARK